MIDDTNEVKYKHKLNRKIIVESSGNFTLSSTYLTKVKNVYINDIKYDINSIPTLSSLAYPCEIEFDMINDEFDYNMFGIEPNISSSMPWTSIKFNNEFLIGMKNIPITRSSLIETINIPDSVESLYYSFQNCMFLNYIKITHNVKDITGAFQYAGMNTYTGLKMTDLIVEFDENSQLTEIGENAFSGSSLNIINIPDSVTSISNGAFCNCSNLTSVTIPDSIQSIGASTFMNCGIESLILGNSITNIDVMAFKGCSNLSNITCLATSAPTIESNTFSNVKTSGILKVPTGSDYSTWLTQLGSGWTIEYI